MSIIIEKIKNNKFVLIAEIGVNYYDIATKMNISPMEAAKLMVKEASEAGIDAVKFQTYKANTLTVKDSPSYWDTTEESTKTQYELFKKFDKFSYEEYKEIKEYCDSLNIEFLSTAFDFESADYLNDLMNVYKISSSDLNNLPFIEYQAVKNKPILLSTGASTFEEIENAVKTIRKVNQEIVCLMHCVLEYPTPYEHANLKRIKTLSDKFPNLVIGYSDHTKPDENKDVIKTAYLMGALVVEKHYTLDKTLPGNDHYHAMDPDDAKSIVKGVEFIDKLLGKGSMHFLDSEKISRLNARRSIVSSKRINKGEVLDITMFTFKRPGTGISPDKINDLIGKIAAKDIEEDQIITNDMIE